MKEEISCRQCIWFDVCPEREVCEDFTSEAEDEILAELEYDVDLFLRHEEYQQQVDEQDS